MMGRLLAVAGGIAASTAAAVAVWSKRKARSGAEGGAGKAGSSTAETGTAGASAGVGGASKASASAAPSDVKPAVEAPGVASEDRGDDLRAIKGIGAISVERLQETGVTTFAQIAAWSPDDVEAIAESIKVSSHRIDREDWVGQAQAMSEAGS